MANAGRDYDAEVQIIGTKGGYVTLSGTTLSYSSVVDMDLKGGAEVAIEVNFDSTPTDHVDVYFFPARDGTAPPNDPDDTGKFLARIDKGTDPNQMTFDIPWANRYWRIGVKQTGSTDSHDVRAYVRTFVWAVS